MQTLELIAALAATAAAGGFAFWVIKKTEQKRVRAWEQACARLGSPFAEGHENAVVEVEVEGGRIQGADATRHVYSPASDLNPYQSGYYIHGFPSRQLPPHFVADVHGAAIGGPQVGLGDPDFDDEVIVGSSDPEAVKGYLNERRRAALRAFFAAVPSAFIARDKIIISNDGRPQADRLYTELGAVRGLLAALADDD